MAGENAYHAPRGAWLDYSFMDPAFKRKTMEIIAIANLKGGSGKTTTALALARALVLAGLRVLVMDLSAQGTAVQRLHQKPTGIDLALLEVNPGHIDLLLVETSEEFYVAGGVTYFKMVPEMSVKKLDKPPSVLRDSLATLASDFDVVLLDCPSVVSHILYFALFAAHSLLIPAPLEFFSAESVRATLEIEEDLENYFSKPFAGAHVLPLFFDSLAARRPESLIHADGGRKAFVFPFQIPRDRAVSNCEVAGRTVVEFAPLSRAAFAYLQLGKSVLDNINKNIY